MKKIAIVGAGISGLEAARQLEKSKNVDITIFEASDRVGGRIKTDRENGFLFDHGFQVFLPAYPSAKQAFTPMQLFSFEPGAIIWKEKNFIEISDPIRRPLELLSTLLGNYGTFQDKLKVLKLKNHVKGIWDDTALYDSQTTLDFLVEFGFSDEIIQSFFKPFFSGIFLERELKTEASFFRFLFNIFSNCYASLPSLGMEDLSKNLSEQIRSEIKLNHSIKDLSELSDFDSVISSDPQLINANFKVRDTELRWRTMTTYYYSLKRFPFDKPVLFLNGEGSGPINHIAPLSLVNPNYSPDDYELLSVNVLGEKISEQEVKNHLKYIFGNQAESWSFLRSYEVKRALPDSSWFDQFNNSGEYQLIGDFMQSPSLQGALKSGQFAANKVKGQLGL